MFRFGRGWDGLPMMDYTGETPPERGTFFRLYVLKRMRISLQLKCFEPNTPVGCTNLIYETGGKEDLLLAGAQAPVVSMYVKGAPFLIGRYSN